MQSGESQTFCEEGLIIVSHEAADYMNRIFYRESVCLEKRFHLLWSNQVYNLMLMDLNYNVKTINKSTPMKIILIQEQ